MRRFIRRATTQQAIEFGKLVLEMVEKHKDKLDDGLFLNMDDLYWEGSEHVQEVIESTRRQLKYYETGISPEQ